MTQIIVSHVATRPKQAPPTPVDYGGLITRSQGRLTEDQANLLTYITHFGSNGYPIRKIGREWTWSYLSISGIPVPVKTKREAIRSFKVYIDILLDKLAGRGDWS